MTGSPTGVITPLLAMHGIVKSFPGVRALKGVDLELMPGEVHALLGENGAGKSTLIKVLGGAHRPEDGRIEIDGVSVPINSPTDSQQAGVGIIYQEFNLVPAMTVRENMFLGQEHSITGLIPVRSERRRAREVFDRLGVQLDVETPVRRLTVAQQQIVEIAKALLLESRIIVMDEPSAALSPREVDGLFRIIRDLKQQGIGIVYVSHRLDEIFEVCDRATVFRDGEFIATRPVSELDREAIIELMVGRKLENEFPRRPDAHDAGQTGSPPRPPAGLQVSGLNRGSEVRDVSFFVRRGEITALTGLVGAGRTETVRLIFGADPRDSGTVTLDGHELSIRNPRDAIRAGICLLTEDRKQQGLVLNRSVLENFGLPNLQSFSRMGLINRRIERDAFSRYVTQLRIRTSRPEQRASHLSGGNQQKVVLAKWLQRNAEVVIFDEPTRGIDVGAKYEIYLLMQQLAADGKAVLMISSELPEVLGMADRIIVMHEGRITGEIEDVASASQEDIMSLAIR